MLLAMQQHQHADYDPNALAQLQLLSAAGLQTEVSPAERQTVTPAEIAQQSHSLKLDNT